MLIVAADTDDIDSIHLLTTVLCKKDRYVCVYSFISFRIYIRIFMHFPADKINIPVLLVSKTNGDNLFKEIIANKITLEAECYFPRSVAIVGPTRVDYWFDPLDTKNYKFFY